METKDFEQSLPIVLKRIGLLGQKCSDGKLTSYSPIIVKIPETFDFKGTLEDSFKQCGIELIYVDCKTDTADTIFAKMNEAGWHGIASSIDINRANKTEKVISVLLIDHFSDLDDQRARTYIESVLKVNKDNGICGAKNIPIILTFSKEDGMDYFYRSDFNIYDERYWK